MVVYHEIQKDKLADILEHGLALGVGGDKRDKDIAETDVFLNGFRSRGLIAKGLDRNTNIYAYLSDGDEIIDITSGARKHPAELSASPTHTLVCIEADPNRSYVGDLDLYDKIKASLLNGKLAEANRLGQRYWRHVLPLSIYDGSFRRPEVLLTYDIPASNISALKPGT